MGRFLATGLEEEVPDFVEGYVQSLGAQIDKVNTERELQKFNLKVG